MPDEITASEYRKGFTPLKKRSKYGSQITVVDGIRFMSKKEAEYYKKLKLLKDKGEITELELQPRFPYKILYTLQRPDSPIVEKKETYVADFRIKHKDGTTEVIDTKGFLTNVAKRKIEVTEKLYCITVKIV